MTLSTDERLRRADEHIKSCGPSVTVVLHSQGVPTVWTVRDTPGMIYLRLPSATDATGQKVIALTVAQYEALDDLFGAINAMKFSESKVWNDVFSPDTVVREVV